LKDVSHAEAGKFYYYARPNYTFGVKYYGTWKYRGADKSLARPGRKQATATKPAEMSNTPRW
jgi:hypothetical protein